MSVIPTPPVCAFDDDMPGAGDDVRPTPTTDGDQLAEVFEDLKETLVERAEAEDALPGIPPP